MSWLFAPHLLQIQLVHLRPAKLSNALKSFRVGPLTELPYLIQRPCHLVARMGSFQTLLAVKAAMRKSLATSAPVCWTRAPWMLCMETATRRCAEAFVVLRTPLPDAKTRGCEGRPSWGNCAATKPLHPSAPLPSSVSIRTSYSSSIPCLTHARVGKASMVSKRNPYPTLPKHQSRTQTRLGARSFRSHVAEPGPTLGLQACFS